MLDDIASAEAAHPQPELTERAAAFSALLEPMAAQARIEWALDQLEGRPVLSSSFGAQAAVMLHLLTSLVPDIPVILVDTGYLFPETYRFIDTLSERLRLNLRVYRPQLGSAWMEARYGHLWEKGLEGIERYNALHKIEPMRRALDDLQAGLWFAGLRRCQAQSRAHTPLLQRCGARWKVSPIADWSDRDVWIYLQRHQLPYHPL